MNLSRSLYHVDELPKLDALANLFQEWQDCSAMNENELIKKNVGNMVFDGFYPYYFKQPKRVLFVGREARGIEGCNYLDIIFPAYRSDKKIGSQHLNFNAFHSRMLHISWGLLNGMPDWDAIPWADVIGDTFGTDQGISFAFMNTSKLSNESEQWTSNWEMIAASHDDATKERNFISEEVALLEPDIVITMNLDKRLDSLGHRELIMQTPKANSYWLDTNGHRSLLIDTYHFSAPGMSHVAGFYQPIREAVQLHCPGIP